MRILISGGTGFIGVPLVQHLARAGHEVRVLSRRPEQVQRALPSGAQAVAFEAGAAISDATMDGVDAVMNLAGESLAHRWTPEHKQRVLRTRVATTEALARSAAAHRATTRAFISASAIGYYGTHG